MNFAEIFIESQPCEEVSSILDCYISRHLVIYNITLIQVKFWTPYGPVNCETNLNIDYWNLYTQKKDIACHLL